MLEADSLHDSILAMTRSTRSRSTTRSDPNARCVAARKSRSGLAEIGSLRGLWNGLQKSGKRESPRLWHESC